MHAPTFRPTCCTALITRVGTCVIWPCGSCGCAVPSPRVTYRPSSGLVVRAGQEFAAVLLRLGGTCLLAVTRVCSLGAVGGCSTLTQPGWQQAAAEPKTDNTYHRLALRVEACFTASWLLLCHSPTPCPAACSLSPEAGESSGERQPWDFGRFVKTVLYFNPPPPPQEILKSILEQPGKLLKSMASTSVEVSSAELTQGQGPGGMPARVGLCVVPGQPASWHPFAWGAGLSSAEANGLHMLVYGLLWCSAPQLHHMLPVGRARNITATPGALSRVYDFFDSVCYPTS